jgi:1-acyl-sn-glycerol-3-phosphate acyltransferase
MKKLFWLLYQPYKWLIFVPILGISGMLLSINSVLLAYLINARAGSMVSGIIWSRLCSFITPMFVSVRGRENIDRKQSYVVVANHQSHFDIFVIYGWLFMDVKWVMKKELRKVPFIGWACEKLEFIYVDRSDNQKAIESLNSARERIINGTSVIFFPEGTRSKDGSFGRFKKGAFRMAVDLGLPILPITIKGTRKVLPSGSFNLQPGRAEMVIHEAISTKEYNDGNVEDLVERIRNLITEEFYAK